MYVFNWFAHTPLLRRLEHLGLRPGRSRRALPVRGALARQAPGAARRRVLCDRGGAERPHDRPRQPAPVPYRNGRDYLIPCLQSHQPLDLVVVYLGTNDLSDRYGLPPLYIARAAVSLATIAATSGAGPENRPPVVLVLGLPRLGQSDALRETMAGAAAKAAELPRCFRLAAEEVGVPLLDLSEVTGAVQRPRRHPPRRRRPSRRRGRSRRTGARAARLARRERRGGAERRQQAALVGHAGAGDVEAVPWSTTVRTTGRPIVMFTPPRGRAPSPGRGPGRGTSRRRGRSRRDRRGRRRCRRAAGRRRRCRPPAPPRSPGAIFSSSSPRPNRPFSPACGLMPQTAMRGALDAGARRAPRGRGGSCARRGRARSRDRVDEADVGGDVDDPQLRRGQHHRHLRRCR